MYALEGGREGGRDGGREGVEGGRDGKWGREEGRALSRIYRSSVECLLEDKTSK